MKSANDDKRGFAQILLILAILVIPITALIVFYSQKNRTDKKINAQVVALDKTRVMVSGNNYFLLGANYPWLAYGNDFGSNAWGSFGVHSSSTYDSNFADMKARGVHVLRWWVFADGRAGIKFDSAGTPLGIDSFVFTDLDAAVATARKYNIYLNLVFFDFSFLNNPISLGSGITSGGHSNVFSDGAKTSALINNVVAPIMTRYANEPYILSWEAMNEPEWVISDLPQRAVQSKVVPITMSQFWNFASQFSNQVHSKTKSYVTIGSASLKWNKVWTNAFAAKKGLPPLNLDYYQTHYYSWMDPYQITNDPDLGTTWMSPLRQDALQLNLDKPIVVGEIPDDNSNSYCAGSCVGKIFANNYAGYWPWSYNYQKTGDKIQVSWQTYTPWEALQASITRISTPGSNSVPSSVPSPITTPTPTPVPVLQSPTPKPIVVTCSSVDFDHDGSVSILDLTIMSKAYGAKLGDSKYNGAYDLNGDGMVSLPDFNIAAKFFGQKCK